MFLGSEAKMSLSAKSSLQSTRRKFFMNSTYTCLESRNKTFSGLGGRNESKCQKLDGIDKKKIFHELDVHHV